MSDADDLRKLAALEELARWLIGERPLDSDPRAASADAAISELLGGALAEIAIERPMPSECKATSDSLPDYVALGARAAETMPAIEEHLRKCEQCAVEFGVLAGVREDGAAWRELANATANPSPRLMLVGKTWHWLSGAGRRLVPLSDEDLELGRWIGSWQLQRSATGAFAFRNAGGAAEQLSLSAPLDEFHSRLHLRVTPQFLATVNASVWLLGLRVERGVTVPRLRAGVGNAQRVTKGWRTLEPDKEVEFRLDDPGGTTWWLHLEWSNSRGETLRKALEISLASESEGQS